MLTLVLLSLLLDFGIQRTHAQCDVVNDYIGTNSPNAMSNMHDGSTGGNGYLILGSGTKNVVSCCGTVSSYTIVPHVIADDTIYFQIWRPGTGTTYQLIGEHSFALTTAMHDKEQTLTPAAAISVEINDRIGWWSSGTNLLQSKNVGGQTIQFGVMAHAVVGNQVDWNTGIPTNSGNTYAFKALLSAGSSPIFTSPAAGTTVTLANSDPIGTAVTSLVYSDPDAYDTVTVSMAANAKYDLSVTDDVTVLTSLAGPSTTETLTFTATDACSNDATLTVTVSITNEAPTINNMPSATTLSVGSSAKTLLFTIDATDTIDTVTCNIAAASTAYPFSVEQNAGTLSYELHVNANPGFDYSVKRSYKIDVDCDDGEFTDTGSFYVYILPNAAPIFTNIQAETTFSTTSAVNDVVFTVIATDAEGDILTYSMTCDPTPCPFDFDVNTGIITLNADISTSTTTGYDITFTVTDTISTVGPNVLSVLITDINDPVVISNLPLSGNLQLSENKALGTQVYQVSISDQDIATQTMTYTMTSSGTGLNYLSIDSTSGLISTSTNSINYETLSALGETSFTLTVGVNDGLASDSQTLTIDLTDLNENPSFSSTAFNLATTEGMAGTVIGTPAFGVTDPDTGDSYTFSHDCGSSTSYFYMDPATGQVSFLSDYDIDSGLAATATCTVTVTDSAGATDTASIFISISDTNDNTPVISPNAYSFFVSYYSSIGTVVGSILGSDGDAGAYGVVVYSIDQASLFDEYFLIDSNGQITVNKSPSGIGYTTSVSITATVTDAGGLSHTIPVTIVIADTTTASTTTSTEGYKKFIDDTQNIPWLIACLILLCVVVVCVAYVSYTCTGIYGFRACRRSCCKGKTYQSRTQKYPVTHTPSAVPMTIRLPPPPILAQKWRSNQN